MGKKIKFMGSAHVQLLEKGENFGGRLAEGLSKELRWDQSNNWIIDTDDASLTDEQVEIILEDSEYFADVTDLDRIPTNAHQRIFLAMTDKTEKREDVPVLRDADRAAASSEGEADESTAEKTEDKPEGSEPANDPDLSATTTTTGGSTRGGRRGSGG
jgi:hypothetical protein